MTDAAPITALQTPDTAVPDIRRSISEFQAPDIRSGLFQIATSVGGFVVTCAVMYMTAEISSWISLALSPLAAGFLIRIFIIQHDCGHGAFFPSRRLNDVTGFLCGLLTVTPYASWRRQHAGHHGVWNNLDRRNTGADIYSSCLTVSEYQALSTWKRRWYRLSRSTFIANFVAPPLVFLLLFRLPFDMPDGWRRERLAVYLTNLCLVALFTGLGFLLGFERVLLVQLPAIALASIIGVWLFTIQHRSDHTVWARQKDWDVVTASLQGSNHLKLPRWLQWFTGNIGLHHIHHLNPKIPNYRLQDCHDALDAQINIPVLTLGAAFRAMFYTLWDETNEKMVTFGSLPARSQLTR